ncbi:Methionine aminopeptidase 1, mitochondrial [Streptomyces tendae]
MLTAFARAFKTPDLRKKLLFTLGIIVVYRVGTHIPIPGVDYRNVQTCIDAAQANQGLFGLVNMFSGGALLQITVFALGIMPHITASIILQLLTVVIPRLEALKKEGLAGNGEDHAVHALPDGRARHPPGHRPGGHRPQRRPLPAVCEAGRERCAGGAGRRGHHRGHHRARRRRPWLTRSPARCSPSTTPSRTSSATASFPATICTSVNEVVVHGIPSDDVVLKDGDIISIDCGAIVDGWHGDAAYTAFVGSGHSPELVELSRVTEESMWAGIAAMKQGNRLVDVSRAIETYIRRQPKPGGGKYGIIEDYGGHGIGTEMHMDPHLLNYVDRKRGKGPKLVPGFCLAIEPMVSLGTPRTEVLSDDWTVITTDGTWSSHWEHSVALTEQGPLVLTAPDGGKAKLAELGITAAPDPLG